MMHKIKYIKGIKHFLVECPDCKIEHPISHRNYYSAKKGIRNLSFRCAKCGQLRAAKTRRKPRERWLNYNGYYKVFIGKGEPMADVRGEIFEHRLIMSQMLSRPLRKNEHVHHRNRNKKDNRPENLKLMDSYAHYLTGWLERRIKKLESILIHHHIPIP